MQGCHMEFNRLPPLINALARSNTFPVAGGLFKGDYGSDAHGVEFIHLQLPSTAFNYQLLWPDGAKGIDAIAR